MGLRKMLQHLWQFWLSHKLSSVILFLNGRSLTVKRITSTSSLILPSIGRMQGICVSSASIVYKSKTVWSDMQGQKFRMAGFGMMLLTGTLRAYMCMLKTILILLGCLNDGNVTVYVQVLLTI